MEGDPVLQKEGYVHKIIQLIFVSSQTAPEDCYNIAGKSPHDQSLQHGFVRLV